MAARRQNRTRSRRRPDFNEIFKKKVKKEKKRCDMPRTKRSYKNTKVVKDTVVPQETTEIDTTVIPEHATVIENNEEITGDIDTNVTYFVDEEGRYYYQPGEVLVPMVDTEENLIQETVEVEETTPTVVQAVPTEGFQTVTLVPSKDSNGELSYVLVVQEDPAPIINVDIKEESPVVDVYNFENEEEESPEEEEPEDTPTPAKRKRKLRIPRATFTCNFCNYSSHRRYLLIRHMKSHSEERPHKCEVCERGFKTIASLQNHTNMHNGVKPHICKHCQSTFTTSGELVRHVRYKHTYEKPHKCTECDYASVELSKLRRHVRCHTGERPYQCPHCTYASPDTFKLKRHLRTHTGEKPYKCDQCTMCFTQSNSLKAHRLIHNVSEKPVYLCELCPAKCGRKTDLRIHVQKLHTSEQPLKCKRCGKTFPDRYSCKMHNKTHDGEKCYKCDLCPYASTTQRHLKSHLLKHTDEKPFSCDDCDQSFRQKQLLRRHQNLYHNPNYVPKPPKEKTHTCHECRRTFAHKGNLIRHLAIHDPDSGHQQRALALKIGRQKKVKYIDGETLRVLQEETRKKARAQMRKIGMTPEIKADVPAPIKISLTPPEMKRGELVTMDDGDGQQYVVLEVIQLEDGSEQHVAVVRPDFLTLQPGTKITEGMMIEVDSEPAQNVEEVGTDALEMGTELEEEEEEEEEDMQTKMQKHLENKERAAAEASIKLEQEVDACFGFVEEDGDADEVFAENIIYGLN